MRVRFVPALAVVSSTALLVVGLDYATLAATGDSLILGRHNQSRDTTVLAKPGPGPALRLSTHGNKKPSLAVSSTARVRHLNADTVDGKSAKSLATKAVTFTAGTRGTVYQEMNVWETPVKPGLYHVSFRVGIQPSEVPVPSFEVICGVADLNTVTGPTTDIYTVESGINTGAGVPTLMSGAESVRVKRGARPGVVCVRPSDFGEFTFFAPLKASFSKINDRVTKTARQVEPPPMPRWLR